MFFNGRTDWQEEVETIYATEDGIATSVLKQDAENIRAFYESAAQGRRVAWPGGLTNFQSSETDGAGNPTCTTNAAMCCWPKDRQANDGNGNCATPYDSNCVDKDPADNTNLCYVDMERGNESTDFDSAGYMSFDGDNNDGEGAIHCHGLAWSNDVNDHTARYRGNNLFFVSMYDHLYQRGYVENIPGAPMCGCVEQMPTVTRSDCTQVDLTESIRINFDSRSSTFAGKLTDVHVDFNSCRGVNNRNNDLWAYMARLYYQGDIEPDQFGEAGRIITNTHDCGEAQRYELSRKGYKVGHDHDVELWTLVAGRDAMALHDGYGMEAFNQAMAAGASSEDQHFGIIRRICQGCVPSHKSIFYRRLTSVPTDKNLISNLLYSSRQDPGNIWNVDFTLHSTYDDAVSGDNAWKCPGNAFNYHSTFVGDCSPDGTRVRHQESRFDVGHHKKNVAFFVNKPESEGLQVETDGLHKIRGEGSARGTVLRNSNDNTVVINGIGRNIWNKVDDIIYYAQPAEGDLTVVAHVGNMQQAAHWQNPQVHNWAKSGIMIRSSLDPDSVHYSLLLTGNNGIAPVARECTGCNTRWWGGSTQVNKGAKEAWLRLEKRVNTLITYVGEQEVADGPITWSQTHSIEYPQLGDEYYIGLAVSSVHTYPLEVTFSDYEVEQYFFPSAAPSISSAPTVFVASRDIGNVGIAGSASQSSAGEWTVTASGYDIWGKSDQFHFVNFPTSGNFEVQLKVDSFDYVHPWQKGGLMIRDTLDANSAHFSVLVTGNQRLGTFWRGGKGWNTSHVAGGTNDKPVWIKAVKEGNKFFSYFSYDGVDFTLFRGPETLNFSSDDVEVGIAVCSHNNNLVATLTGGDLVIEKLDSSARKLRGAN